jgi:hypothetical protein
MHENKNIFFLKPGILIPNLYVYNIKIQTNINQNDVEKTWENHTCSKMIFEYIYFFNWAGPA